MGKTPPQNIVWAPGGTRRLAKLEKVDFSQYPSWVITNAIREVGLFLDKGSKRVFYPVISPGNMREQGKYAELIKQLVQTAFTSKEARRLYAESGLRVKFYGQEAFADYINAQPEFLQGIALVMQETSQNTAGELWWGFVTDEQTILWDALSAAKSSNATSLAEAIKAYYGEPLEQIDIMIGTGKFQAGALIPPLLGQKAALYWTDFPGGMITAEDVDKIFNDYATQRHTWVPDKEARTEALDEEELERRYAKKIIWGVGEQENGYWHHLLHNDES